jgi:hypothetical protein
MLFIGGQGAGIAAGAARVTVNTTAHNIVCDLSRAEESSLASESSAFREEAHGHFCDIGTYRNRGSALTEDVHLQGMAGNLRFHDLALCLLFVKMENPR